MECAGAGRRRLREDPISPEFCVRIEVLAPPDLAEKMLTWLHREIIPSHAVTACLETVEVLRADEFAPPTAGMVDGPSLDVDRVRSNRSGVTAAH